MGRENCGMRSILTPPTRCWYRGVLERRGARPQAPFSAQSEQPRQALEQARLPAIHSVVGRLLLAAAHFHEQLGGQLQLLRFNRRVFGEHHRRSFNVDWFVGPRNVTDSSTQRACGESQLARRGIMSPPPSCALRQDMTTVVSVSVKSGGAADRE